MKQTIRIEEQQNSELKSHQKRTLKADTSFGNPCTIRTMSLQNQKTDEIAENFMNCREFHHYEFKMVKEANRVRNSSLILYNSPWTPVASSASTTKLPSSVVLRDPPVWVHRVANVSPPLVTRVRWAQQINAVEVLHFIKIIINSRLTSCHFY